MFKGLLKMLKPSQLDDSEDNNDSDVEISMVEPD